MAITNTKCVRTSPTWRRHGYAEHEDHLTQPRILQPITGDTNVTSANGFNSTNCRPGDLLLVANSDDALETDKVQLFVRNPNNNGWLIFKLDSGNT